MLQSVSPSAKYPPGSLKARSLMNPSDADKTDTIPKFPEESSPGKSAFLSFVCISKRNWSVCTSSPNLTLTFVIYPEMGEEIRFFFSKLLNH